MGINTRGTQPQNAKNGQQQQHTVASTMQHNKESTCSASKNVDTNQGDRKIYDWYEVAKIKGTCIASTMADIDLKYKRSSACT